MTNDCKRSLRWRIVSIRLPILVAEHFQRFRHHLQTFISCFVFTCDLRQPDVFGHHVEDALSSPSKTLLNFRR